MKSSIYTRKGDAGSTSLIGGRRVPKTCARLESYGCVDELNAQVGLLLAEVMENANEEAKASDNKAKAIDNIKHEELANNLIDVQRHLFVVGAMLASDPEAPATLSAVITEADVASLERIIDRMSEGLPAWRGFTLPGGSRAAAMAHVCRTICRRAERSILALADEVSPEPESERSQEAVSKELLSYMNRLSDYFYVLALRINILLGKEEIMWKIVGNKEK